MIIAKPHKINEMGLEERLALLNMLPEALKERQLTSQRVAELFEGLNNLINKTVSGSKISIIKDFSQANAFHTIEVSSEQGSQLARLHMLYLKKPVQAYYLVYVEVQYPFRKKGIGTRVLNYFKDFLDQKNAIGLLDNVIPKDDPTYEIYLKNGWHPITRYISLDILIEGGDYMVYLPPKLRPENIRENLKRLLYHIQRKKTFIHVRENESMVKLTISEFVNIYNSLCTYFAEELRSNIHTPLLRYVFTKFATKLISFRRRISELIGYTGGESMEQIRISDSVKSIPVLSYTPRGMTQGTDLLYGDLRIFKSLPGALQRQPARFIESLPNYRRPSFVRWLTQKGYAPDHRLTIGDLLDLGFDPTRLKEFAMEGKKYIFERIQPRHVEVLIHKTGDLLELKEGLRHVLIDGATVGVSQPVLILTDGGNAYVLREKVDGIHWDEAMEQFQDKPPYAVWSQYINLEGLLKKALNKLHTTVEAMLGRELPFDYFTYFVSWNFKTNQPKVMIDFHKSYFERLWIL
jgi:hypothetical protein